MSPKQQAMHAKHAAQAAAAAQKRAATLQTKAAAAQAKADQKTSAAAAYGVAAAASNTKVQAVTPDASGSPTSSTIVAAPLNQGVQIGNGTQGAITINDTAPLTALAQSSQDALAQSQQQSAATIADIGGAFATAAQANAEASGTKQTPASVWIGLAGLVLTAAYYLGGKK